MRQIIIVAAAALMAVSCSGLDEKNYLVDEETQTTKVHFAVFDDATKSIATSIENTINTLQFFVFGADGSLEVKSGSKYAVSSADVLCTQGEKKVVAVVNAPDLPNIRAYDDFYELNSNLSENRKNRLVMVGDTTITVSLTEPESVAIKVTRLGVRVGLRSISNKLANKASMIIKNVYLINAAGNRTYLGGGAPTVWYNKRGNQNDIPEVLTYSLDGQLTLDYNSSREFSYNFAYCYPNPVATDTSAKGDWTERFTRAVLEAQIGGVTYYYPISLPGLKTNTAYTISLVVTRLGSDDPDVPVTTNEISYTLDIVDWKEGAFFQETI